MQPPLLAAFCAVLACAPAGQEIPKVLLSPDGPEWKSPVPAEYLARFSTSQGEFAIYVQRVWAPIGADRFYHLVKNGYYDDVRFFRVVSGFMAQFGIHGTPEVNAVWNPATILDDPVMQSNRRGWVSFAKRGDHSRSTQVFVSYTDRNAELDKTKFAPFGKVVEGMDVVDKLHSGYGESPPRGRGPSQPEIHAKGNRYLAAHFKNLDYVKSARIVERP